MAAKDRARDPKRVPSLGIGNPKSHVRVVNPNMTGMSMGVRPQSTGGVSDEGKFQATMGIPHKHGGRYSGGSGQVTVRGASSRREAANKVSEALTKEIASGGFVKRGAEEIENVNMMHTPPGQKRVAKETIKIKS